MISKCLTVLQGFALSQSEKMLARGLMTLLFEPVNC
jgi:hypothetical protein